MVCMTAAGCCSVVVLPWWREQTPGEAAFVLSSPVQLGGGGGWRWWRLCAAPTNTAYNGRQSVVRHSASTIRVLSRATASSLHCTPVSVQSPLLYLAHRIPDIVALSEIRRWLWQWCGCLLLVWQPRSCTLNWSEEKKVVEVWSSEARSKQGKWSGIINNIGFTSQLEQFCTNQHQHWSLGVKFSIFPAVSMF